MRRPVSKTVRGQDARAPVKARIVLGVLGIVALLALFASTWLNSAAAAPEDGPYTASLLDSTYFALDLFVLNDGTAQIAYGARDFDGESQLTSLVSFAGRSPLSYEVAPDGRFRLYANDFNGTYTGSIGLGGGLALYSRRAASGEDNQAPGGYAAARFSLSRESGSGDIHFKGAYGYHALIREPNAVWRNVIGAADADGAGTLTLVRPTLAIEIDYDVQGNGQVAIGDQGPDFAALADNGDIVFHALDVASGDDPLYDNGYRGFAVYVRRETARAATVADFHGTYRVHELRISGSSTRAADVGSFTAGGNGVFFGSLGGRDYADRIVLQTTGEFRFRDETINRGTLGANGDFAVVSRENGVVQHGSGEARLQFWVRTAGGRPIPGDADGDGVRDSVETARGMNPQKPDTDSDGYLDNYDPRPATADNVFTATLAQTSFTVAEGGAAPSPVTLTLDSGDFPYFNWRVVPDVAWITATPESGEGDRTVSIRLNTAGFEQDRSPYRGHIRIEAPDMQPHTDLDIVVNVTGPPIRLDVLPTSLTFFAVEGQTLQSAPQSVALSSPDAATFAWEAEATGNWLRLDPATGSGPGAMQIAVNPTGLTTANSPYSGSVRFSVPGSSAEPVALPVTLTILPQRGVGTPFRLSPTLVAQTNAATAAGGNYFVAAWTEESAIRATALDLSALPLVDRALLSIPAQGAADAPAVAVSADGVRAWIVWEQQVDSQSALQARELRLDTGALSAVFGIAGGTGDAGAAAVCFQPSRNEFAVAYQSTDANADVRLAIFSAATHAKRFDVAIAGSAEDELAPCIAYDPVRDQYLVAWTRRFVNDAETVESRIIARRISPADGSGLGMLRTVQDTTGVHTAPRAAYNVTRDGWTVTWHYAASENADSQTVRLARFPAGDDATPPTISGVSEDPATVDGHGLSFAPESEQHLLAWTTSATPRKVLFRRITAAGYALRGIEAAPGNAESFDAATAHNAASPEYLAVWTDRRDGLPQVYAMRVDAGTSDEDADGLPNDWEFENGLDPLSADGEDGALGDPDSDGLTNLEEFTIGSNPKDRDSDDDGLWDRQEDRNRNGVIENDETHPRESDTDSDGFDDATEWFLGSNGNSAASLPPPGIVRLEYGTWEEGVAADLVVHVAVTTAGEYRLDVNGPAGWAAALTDGAASRSLEPGSRRFTISITPQPPVTPATDHGTFAFRFSGPGVDTTRTAVLVVDRHETTAGGATSPALLAQTYAPVIKLHRGEFYRPVPIETTLERSALDLGNTFELRATPDPLNLFQSPQLEARVDIEGNSLEQLREDYPAPAEQPAPVAYYTVTTLGNRSAAPSPPPDHIALQYYLYFHADEWGRGVTGGHRHEGDWELVQILFDDELNPYAVTATQRREAARDASSSGGVRANWNQTERWEDTHAVLYGGLGGHSLYFTSGATRYHNGLEVHDGLGPWAVPENVDARDYTQNNAFQLVPLGRLGEAGELFWQRYAGLWGQKAFPADPLDRPSLSSRDGVPGPVFLGDSGSATSSNGVRSYWTDPYAWNVRAHEYTVPMTTVRGSLPAALANDGAVLCDGRGQVFRTIVQTDGNFEISLPVSIYALVITQSDAFGVESFVASATFADGAGSTMLFPTQPAGNTELGTFTLLENGLEGSDIYTRTDSDADAIPNNTDPDMDNDGIANDADEDALGDGFDDDFQIQDPDNDGIPSYWDDDDDGDGMPDAEDPDVNGDGMPDSQEPPDADGDGFIDAVDLDIDNDGFSNIAENLAGTDPYHPLDTPEQRVGDINEDGKINAADLQLQINMIIRSQAFSLRADFDQNGLVDALDLQRTINRILEIE